MARGNRDELAQGRAQRGDLLTEALVAFDAGHQLASQDRGGMGESRQGTAGQGGANLGEAALRILRAQSALPRHQGQGGIRVTGRVGLDEHEDLPHRYLASKRYGISSLSLHVT